MIYTNPLTWPVGWPRTEEPIIGRFNVTLDEAERDMFMELDRLGAMNHYLSTDAQLTRNGRPVAQFGKYVGDQSVVLHFIRQGQELDIPCDRFTGLRDNVRAIGLTLQAIRSMERYGTSQMMDAALSGFAQLPAGAGAPAPSRPWHEVLGIAPDASRELIKAAYQVAVRKTHPDAGGSETAFKEVQNAFEEATNASS